MDDSIDKILWRAKRVPSASHMPGDLRWDDKELAGGDPGFIYRTTDVTWIDFSSRFIRQLLVGVLGSFWTSFLTLYLWVGLAVVALVLVFVGRTRHAGFVFVLVAVVVAALLRYSRIDAVYPALWLIPGLATAIALVLWLGPQHRLIGRLVFAALGLLFVLASLQVTAFVDGKKGDLNIGPVPKGTPVNLIMNLNPEAPIGALLEAAFGMTRGFLRIKKDSLTDGAALKAFEEEAGLPLLKASKCPDFVLDRGHWFAEALTDDEKRQLKAFLKTL
jgi:hypothetical protein